MNDSCPLNCKVFALVSCILSLNESAIGIIILCYDDLKNLLSSSKVVSQFSGGKVPVLFPFISSNGRTRVEEEKEKEICEN